MRISQKCRGSFLIDSAAPLGRSSARANHTDNSNAHSNGLHSIDTNDLDDTSTKSHDSAFILSASPAIPCHDR